MERYFPIDTVSDSGLLVYRKANPHHPNFDLIIVLEDIASGMISDHLQLGHPNKTHFKKVWNQYFFALDSEGTESYTIGYPLGTSMRKKTKELLEQST